MIEVLFYPEKIIVLQKEHVLIKQLKCGAQLILTLVSVSGIKNNTRSILARERDSAYKAGRSPHAPEDRSLFKANHAPVTGPTMNPIENAKPTNA